jgi:hypothetical protein
MYSLTKIFKIIRHDRFGSSTAWSKYNSAESVPTQSVYFVGWNLENDCSSN